MCICSRVQGCNIYATKKYNPPYKVYIDLSDTTERTESKKRNTT